MWSCYTYILYHLAIPSSKAGETDSLSQPVSSPPAADKSDEEGVLPEDTIEEVTAKIIYIERQILSSSDPEEKKQLWEKEKQLREEKNQLQD